MAKYLKPETTINKIRTYADMMCVYSRVTNFDMLIIKSDSKEYLESFAVSVYRFILQNKMNCTLTHNIYDEKNYFELYFFAS